MRSALATLPWVEKDTIRTDLSRREVYFDLNDKKQFNETALRKALEGQGFKEVSVKSAPKSTVAE